jgi:hypothetical protein
MKHLFLLFFLMPLTCLAQNLVPNPSFEEYSECPDGGAQVDRAIGWFSSRETPEYFNSCSTNPLVNVPESDLWGYQIASTGNAYCGFQCYFTPGFREALGCQLTQPLSTGTEYYVSFKLSCAFGGIAEARCAVNNIGLRFSNSQYSVSTPVPIDNFSHVYSSTILSDTVNWVEVSGYFTPNTEYEYLYIGNFFDDNNTDTIWLMPDAGCRAYYLVDDVCVTQDPQNCDMVNSTQVLSSGLPHVFPNPFRSSVYVETSKKVEQIKVHDGYGREFFGFEIDWTNWNKAQLDLSKLEDGIYIITIDATHSKTIIKSNP